MVRRTKSTSAITSSKSLSSPQISRAADVAALEAHFLASFAGADFDQQRKQEIRSGKMKQVAPSAEANMGLKRTDPAKESGKAQYESPRSTVSTAQRQNSALRRKPVTVVFDEGGSTSSGSRQETRAGGDQAARKNWKDFMNTKTSNTGPDAFSSASEFIRERNAAKQQKKREAEEAADDENGSDDEAAQVTNDRQLSHLLNTTLFARGSFNSDSGHKEKPDLSSHATLSRILELSSSSQARKGQVFGRGHGDKALKASQLKDMPAKIRQGIRSAAGDRAEKEVERNREMGLLSDAYSKRVMGRQYEDETMVGKKRGEKDRVRGLSMGVGKFKGGILRLSKEEVDKMTGEGRQGGRGASSRGGRGGLRGGASKKRRVG